jgi:hypothetical protein
MICTVSEAREEDDLATGLGKRWHPVFEPPPVEVQIDELEDCSLELSYGILL